jgi:hypothetical protein
MNSLRMRLDGHAWTARAEARVRGCLELRASDYITLLLVCKWHLQTSKWWNTFSSACSSTQERTLVLSQRNRGYWIS